jgi:hypothetical protein
MGGNNFSRSLTSRETAEEFVRNILNINDTNTTAIAYKIKNAELLMVSTINQSSINSPSECIQEYREKHKRKELHERIIEELFSTPRLENDEDIMLGKGGALPLNGKVECNREAYIITGLPASGKSGLTSRLSDSQSAIIIDNDYAKRKIPEFHVIDAAYSANFVHEEASIIVEGEDGLLSRAVSKGYNLIYPKIGHRVESLVSLAKALKDNDYKVYLVLVSLDRQKAVQRAYNRFVKTGRYVPLSLVFDGYANDPILTYYRIKVLNSDRNCFDGLIKISSDVPFGKVPMFVDGEGTGLIKSQEDVDKLYEGVII